MEVYYNFQKWSFDFILPGHLIFRILAVTSCIKYIRLSLLEPFEIFSLECIGLKLIQQVFLILCVSLNRSVLDNG